MNIHKHSYYLGKSLEDLQTARKLGKVAVIVNTDDSVLGEATPDYFICALSEFEEVKKRKYDQIIFDEIEVSQTPFFKKLFPQERVLLQDHFRRIQQHSIATGRFMRHQAEILQQNPEQWETTGILHDIDYGRTYFNIERHGFESPPILNNYSSDKDLISAIEFHTTSKYCNTKFLLGWSTYISEMFTKRFVHTMRKKKVLSPLKINFQDFVKVYDGEDFRKNERLTRLEPSSMPYKDFKIMMGEHDKATDNFPIPKGKLFFLAQKAFNELNIFPLGETHKTEVTNLKLL